MVFPGFLNPLPPGVEPPPFTPPPSTIGFPPLRPGAPSPFRPGQAFGNGDGSGDSPGAPNFPPGFFEGLLGLEPKASFFSAVNRLGGVGTPQGRFFNTQFENIQNEFLGVLGRQAQESIKAGGGPLPTLSFNQFLQGRTDDPFTAGINEFQGAFDFDKRFRSLAPSLRGQGGTAQFRPPTQFRF